MKYQSEYPGVIHFEQKGHLVILTFDNQKTLNALNYDMFSSINEIFDTMENDEDVWGVILTGAGRAFVAGADLKDPKLSVSDPSQIPPVARRESLRRIHESLSRVADFPHPTLAAINGYALGGGAELGLCCDFRFGSSKAKIGFPETKLGALPAYTGPSRAIRIMGVTATKEMMFTSKHYTAEEAMRLGYLSRICEPEELLTVAEEFMGEILKMAPQGVKYSKLLCDRSSEMSLRNSLEFERLLMCAVGTSEDFKEGTKAFAERRTPEFKGF